MKSVVGRSEPSSVKMNLFSMRNITKYKKLKNEFHLIGLSFTNCSEFSYVKTWDELLFVALTQEGQENWCRDIGLYFGNDFDRKRQKFPEGNFRINCKTTITFISSLLVSEILERSWLNLQYVSHVIMK